MFDFYHQKYRVAFKVLAFSKKCIYIKLELVTFNKNVT